MFIFGGGKRGVSRIGRRRKGPRKKPVAKNVSAAENAAEDGEENEPDEIKTADEGHYETKEQARKRRYFQSEKGKASRAKASKRYAASKDGKEAQGKASGKYFKTPDGKEAKGKASGKYFQTSKGKEALGKAFGRYFHTPEGKAARAKANLEYKNSSAGKRAKLKSDKLFSQKRRHGMNPRAKQLSRRYLNQYREKQRRAQKIEQFVHSETFIDFAGKSTTSTNCLKVHEIDGGILQKYDSVKDEIQKSRLSCAQPISSRSNRVAYRIVLAERLQVAFENRKLSMKSLSTCGASTGAMNNKYRQPSLTAGLTLSDRVYQQRQMCINKLKSCSYYLRDLAIATIAAMELNDKSKDRKLALLGLQCHTRATEPFFSGISYADGGIYDFSAKTGGSGKNTKTGKKKDSENHFYPCNENCLLLQDDDTSKLVHMIERAAQCPKEKGEDWMRQFVSTHSHCTLMGEDDSSSG